MSREQAQDEIDKNNAEFWSEPCGTQLAANLGLQGSESEELKKYDDFFFGFYPYLKKYINPREGEKVLEIGLGYGSVSQWLMESKTIPTFLDIAPGAIEHLKKRAKNIGIEKIDFVNESILEVESLEEASFDKIVAIGCLHHTGNFDAAINKCYQLLKPGGTLIFMVYNAFSYRQFRSHLLKSSLLFLKRELLGKDGHSYYGDEVQNGGYDKTEDGSSAPCTQFLSKKSIEKICTRFKSTRLQTENIGQSAEKYLGDRNKSVDSAIAKNFGTDIYGVCIK